MSDASHNVGHSNESYGVGKKTLSVYFSGFVLCVILTLIPFFSVMYHVATKPVLLIILLVSAIAQFFVQVLCFLRLNNQTEQGRMNVMSFIFTGIVLLVVIGGSVWIMFSLNYFMMH